MPAKVSATCFTVCIRENNIAKNIKDTNKKSFLGGGGILGFSPLL
jgi:hypothetical protein